MESGIGVIHIYIYIHTYGGLVQWEKWREKEFFVYIDL